MSSELKKVGSDDVALDKAHHEAIQRLSLEPGTCSRDGCGETLICVVLESWDGKGKMPPPRFACPEHDVWLSFCFDDGDPEDEKYAEGLYEAALRDPSAPAWRWLPESMRAAAARAGFGMHHAIAFPHVLVGLHAGRAWATDRSNLICIGEAHHLRDAEAELHSSQRDAERHRLADRHFSVVFGGIAADAAPRLRTKATDAGHGPMWDRFVAFGEAVVPGWVVSMVEEIYPGCTWVGGGRLDPVAARACGEIVAVAMPADTIEIERIAREEVCKAEHQHRSDRLELNYWCNLPPGHDGHVHEVRERGRTIFQWDEREYPRTDTVATVSA